MLAVDLYVPFVMLRYVPYILSFSRAFIMKGCWIFPLIEIFLFPHIMYPDMVSPPLLLPDFPHFPLHLVQLCLSLENEQASNR